KYIYKDKPRLMKNQEITKLKITSIKEEVICKRSNILYISLSCYYFLWVAPQMGPMKITKIPTRLIQPPINLKIRSCTTNLGMSNTPKKNWIIQQQMTNN